MVVHHPFEIYTFHRLARTCAELGIFAELYAGPNTTDKPRRAIVTIYMPDTVHFTGAKHIVTEDLNLHADDVLEGERFPVLAEEEKA